MLKGLRSQIAVEGLRTAAALMFLTTIPIAAAYVLGTRIPRDHTAVATGLVLVPPHRVWELLNDFSPQVQWRNGPLVIGRTSGMLQSALPCWQEGWLLMRLPLCQVEAQPDRHRVVETSGPSLPFDATWTYVLAPADSAGATTMLTVTEHSTIEPPLWRFLGRYLFRNHTSARQSLRDLQAEAIRKP